MPIDPNAIGARPSRQPFTWTDRDTMLYALGVGCGTADLAFTTENSHDIPQQVLPTYAVIACIGLPALPPRSATSTGHAAARIASRSRLHAPLPPAGKLNVASEVADIQDKGEGKNAIVVLRARGTDPTTSERDRRDVVDLRDPRRGRLRWRPGRARRGPADPRPRAGFHARRCRPREDQPLIYRLSGDRNPLHSDPWFAQNLAGFPEADHARAVHLRCRRPRAGRRSRRRGRRHGSPGSAPGSPHRCSPVRR